MQLPVEYLLLRMGFAQQSLIAVRNEIMQVCAQMPVDGTNVVALEQILVLCETTLASLDRTYVRIEAWKKIYPNHAGTVSPGNLAFDDDNWVPINDDDDDDNDVLNFNNDALNLDNDDDDDDDDDDFYRVADDEPNDGTNDENDTPPSERYSAYLSSLGYSAYQPPLGYSAYQPPSFAHDNLPVTDNTLTDHEFALLFGLVQPPLAATESATPLMWDIFGNPLSLPANSPTPSHADSTDDTYPDPDPDYNVPGSI